MEQFNTALDRAIYDQTGYKTFTTFAMDYEIAECFGIDAIKDTFQGCKPWIANYKYWTELVMVLNWYIWKHAEDPLGPVYDSLWREAEQMFDDRYADNVDDTDEERASKAEARSYYYQTLD